MSIKSENAEINRWRLTFPDTVISSGFPTKVMLEELGRAFDFLKPSQFEARLAIGVICRYLASPAIFMSVKEIDHGSKLRPATDFRLQP